MCDKINLGMAGDTYLTSNTKLQRCAYNFSFNSLNISYYFHIVDEETEANSYHATRPGFKP